MGHQGWQIGRIFGIPIIVHASWLLVFAFVTWSLATEYLPDALPGQSDARYWGMGSVAALLLFLSVLLHELGHCWVALRYRIPIGRITLFVFGGVAHMRREPATPTAEFLIAMAGPLVSFLLAAVWLGGASLGEWAPAGWQLQGLIVLGSLVGTVNLQIGLFNLIPGFPLDGGRALRAGIWAWTNDVYAATRRSAMAGLVVAVMLIAGGAAVMAAATMRQYDSAMLTSGTWLAMIGLFLFATAKSSRQQAVMRQSLATVPVRALMTQPIMSVPPDITVDAAVRCYLLPHGYGGFPVMEGEALIGLLLLEDVQRVPQARWPWRTVREVMRPMNIGMTIGPDYSALRAVEQMVGADVDRLVVLEDDRVIGIVTRSAMGRFLELGGDAGAFAARGNGASNSAASADSEHGVGRQGDERAGEQPKDDDPSRGAGEDDRQSR
ncbi:MAG: site-2 protease family protein [Nitrospiraceae bacterium]